MASITIEDAERKINAAIFSQKLAQTSEQLVLDEVVVISGKINKDFREQWQVVVDRIDSVDKVQLKFAKYLKKVPIPKILTPGEENWTDGTWAHAVERIPGQISASAGNFYSLKANNGVTSNTNI